MWICEKCNEEIEDNFDVCWNCPQGDEYEEETVGPIVEETSEDSVDEAEENTEEDNESEEVNYDDMKVPDLKAALKEKGLPVSGKKSELIERLKGESK